MTEDRDTFSAAIALIGMAVDPKATSARLAELQKSLDAAAKAQAKLDNDRSAHERTTAADKAATAEREKSLRDREVAVAIKERNLVAREKAIADARPPRFSADPNLSPGTIAPSGLAREAYRS